MNTEEIVSLYQRRCLTVKGAVYLLTKAMNGATSEDILNRLNISHSAFLKANRALKEDGAIAAGKRLVKYTIK